MPKYVPDDLKELARREIGAASEEELEELKAKVDNLPTDSGYKIKNGNSLFEYNIRLDEMHDIDLSMVSICTNMFYESTNLDIMDVDIGADTDITDASNMFYGCTSLTSVNLPNTNKCESVGGMFYGCTSLVSAPDIDASSAMYISSLFGNCTKMVTVPKLIMPSNPISYGGMFNGCSSLTNLYIYNIDVPIAIGSGTSYGHLLTVDSLVHTIKELCTVSSSKRLTMGSANIAKIADLYCKVTDDTTEKIEMELCESTDEGAITLEAYAALKNWTLA